MLVQVSDIAKEFKVDPRTIQNWCKRDKVRKIGNEYQLTEDLVETWRIRESNPKNKTKPKPQIKTDSPTKGKTNTFGFKIKLREVVIGSFIVALFFIGTIVLSFYSYNLNEDIHAKEKTIESKNGELEAVKKENQDIKNKYNDEYVRSKVIQAIDTFKQGKIITPIINKKPLN